MQLGIFAKTFSGSNPASVFAAVAKAGYHAAHYNLACSGLSSMPDDIPAGYAEEVAAEAQRHNVKIVGLSATWNMAHPDSRQRQLGLFRFDISAKHAARIGTRLLTLCTGTRDPLDQWRYHPDNNTVAAWTDMIASVREAVMIAERYDVILGIEPELANIVNDVQNAERLFSEIGSHRLKLVLDPANLVEQDTIKEQYRLIDHAVSKLGERIIMAHAKDRDIRGEVVPAGDGVIDFGYFIKVLHDMRFDGPLITHGLHATEAVKAQAFLHDVLQKQGVM